MTFHDDQHHRSPLSHEDNNSRDPPGNDKDEEIARLKRAYHDAVLENSNKKASAKTNT